MQSGSFEMREEFKRWAVVLLAAVALGGCAIPALTGDGKPGPIRLSLEGASRLNPDERGESLPTSVRVLQLKSRAKVEGLALTELIGDPKELLGDELLGVDELVLEPGSSVDKVIARAEGARVVVVAMLARLPAGSAWREIVDLGDTHGTTQLSFVLEEYRIARR